MTEFRTPRRTLQVYVSWGKSPNMDVIVDIGGRRDWQTAYGVHVTGSAFDGSNRLTGASLARFFSEADTAALVGRLADKLNGYFAAIVEGDDATIGVVDHVGSIPLFYGRDSNVVVIGDDGESVRERLGTDHIDRESAMEYLLFRFVSGKGTLYCGVDQTQPGQVIVAGKSGDTSAVESDAYYDHDLVEPPERNREVLLEEFETLLDRSFERFLEYVDGRTIAVSLSGGYDSRLITSTLRRLGYDDVVTFSCLKGSPADIERAQGVAESLDFPWYYADLDPSDWRDFYESDDWDRYTRFGLSISGKPFVFDLLPLVRLKEQGKIPNDAVIVSGHTAVDPARPLNRYLREDRAYGEREYTDAVIDFHHCQWEYEGAEIEDRLRARILNGVDTDGFETRLGTVEAYERWRWKERESKYILTHHLAVYDYIDNDWWLPLYDRDLLDFWCRVPIDQKAGRELYQRYVERLYADIAGISLSEARVTTGRSRLLSAAEDFLSDTPLKSVASDVFHRYLEWRANRAMPTERDIAAEKADDPRLGVIPDEVLARLDPNVGSFNGLHSATNLGLVDFESDGNFDLPTDGIFRWNDQPLLRFPDD